MTLDEALVAVAPLGVQWARIPNDTGELLLSLLRADRPDGGSLVVAAVILAPIPAGGWIVGVAWRVAPSAPPPTGPTIVIHTDAGVVTWPLVSTVLGDESLLDGVRSGLEAAEMAAQGWTMAMQRWFERRAASC